MSQHFRQIEHPLRRGGQSRPERDQRALDPATAPVDGRGLGDLLRFWYDYARQVNFYEAEAGKDAPTVTGDWLDFFRRSIPFQYATIGSYDLEAIDVRFREIHANVDSRRSFAALNPLLDLLLEMADQLANWQTDLTEDTTGLRAVIAGLITTSLREPAAKLLGLTNGAAKWGYQSRVNLGDLGRAYGLDVLTAFAVDRSISGRRGSPKNKVLAGRDALEELYRIFWKALEATVAAARDDGKLEASLRAPASADTPPSLGLVFTFLLLFRDAQGNLNGLSDEHLDFFYRKTLQLKEKPLVADRAHLVFELGKRVEESLLLERGQRFKAGKDAAGEEILFELPEDLVLTKTQVAEVKTLFLDPEEGGDLYAAPVANSGDGRGGDFPKGIPPAWPTLGGGTMTYPDPENEEATPLPEAELAFLLASPALLLREGNRTVTVTLTLATEEADFPATADLFVPAFSTEEGWQSVEGFPPPTLTPGENGLELKMELTLAPDFPAVVRPGAELLPLDVPREYPCLRLSLRPGLPERRAWYCRLGQLPVTDVHVTVAVCGIRQVTVENDLALLDPTKPFQPFGPVPKKNSSNFYVGSEEVFAKNWTEFDLRLHWLDLPDFDGYYDCYPDPPFAASNVVANAQFRHNFAWLDITPVTTTLLTGGSTPREGCADLVADEVLLRMTNPETDGFAPCPWPLSLAETGAATASCGVVRLQLGAEDFRHDGYPQAILNVTQKNEEITVENDADPDDENKPLKVINPPYTPTLAAVVIDYRAEDGLIDGTVHFGHVHPWTDTYAWIKGVDTGAAAGAGFPLLASFPHLGHLYLGFSEYRPGELLQLYFEVDAPTADPRREKARVRWAYLRGNDWCPLQDETQVLQDTTDGLIRPGIVRIAVPTDASKEGTTILSPAYHWLRASVAENPAAIAATLRVSTQAAEVVAIPGEANAKDRLAEALPAGTVAKLLTPVDGLKGIEQPYPSFGGRAPEATPRYNRRVSELLRHKGRAITLHDYESLTLEYFPRVHRIKCLTHTSGVRGAAKQDLQLAPGYVTLVVVPDVRHVTAVNPFEPRLPAAEQEEIRTFFEDKIGPCVRLSVLSPEYEPVTLRLDVRFLPGKSVAFYREQLQADLRQLLAPWTQPEAGGDISFGGRFYYSTAVHFAEELDYVDYVRDLRVLDPKTGEPVSFQAARYARSVLTTSRQHQIHIIED